jgi:hypothetical protein
MLRRFFVALVSMALLLVLSACTKTETGGVSAGASTNGANDVASLLAQGDYGAVLEVIDKAKISEAEKLGTSGRIILDGLIDPNAKTRPKFSVEEGLSRMEKAVTLGRDTSISDLAALFTNGLGYRDEKKLFAAVPELASCWNEVKSKAKSADVCIALRKSLGVPKN